MLWRTSLDGRDFVGSCVRVARNGARVLCVLGTFGVLPLALAVLAPRPAHAIPYFARKYSVSCSQCHVSVPRLNTFGVEFRARGYAMPPNAGFSPHRTFPLAVWVSGRSNSRPTGATTAEHVRTYLNRVEFISGGRVVAPWLSYFVEWRPVSQESRSDGTLRDRGGRFEDLFFMASGRNLAVTVGQFRQIDQIDVSQRLSLSEPLVLSASLAGSGGGTARERSLRAFAPGARSPSVRVAWNQSLRGGRIWTTSAALPIPGEFSIPLNDEARTEASNEIEFRRKGVFAESYVRSGETSFGAHVFYDDGRRYLADAVVTGQAASLYWTGIGGLAKSGDPLTGRWSLEGEFIPSRFAGLGGRVENRAGDGADVAFLPYLNLSLPATRYTIRFTVERRFQKGRHATLLELGTIF